MQEQSYAGFSAIETNRQGGTIMKFKETLKLCRGLRDRAEERVSLLLMQ